LFGRLDDLLIWRVIRYQGIFEPQSCLAEDGSLLAAWHFDRQVSVLGRACTYGERGADIGEPLLTCLYGQAKLEPRRCAARDE